MSAATTTTTTTGGKKNGLDKSAAAEALMAEHELNERVARLEEGQRWLKAEISQIHRRLDELASLLRKQTLRDGQLSWRVMMQLSGVIAALVTALTYVVQKIG